MSKISLTTESGNKYTINATLAPAERKGFALLNFSAKPDKFYQPYATIAGEVPLSELKELFSEYQKIAKE